MQGPDALDKVPYMPPDKVIHLHQADPDKRQKFSRTLEEEEEENRKRRKKSPLDAVELNSESEETGERSQPGDDRMQKPEPAAANDEKDNAPDKHIDLKA